MSNRGMDVINKIGTTSTDVNDRPRTPVQMVEFTIKESSDGPGAPLDVSPNPWDWTPMLLRGNACLKLRPIRVFKLVRRDGFSRGRHSRSGSSAES